MMALLLKRFVSDRISRAIQQRNEANDRLERQGRSRVPMAQWRSTARMIMNEETYKAMVLPKLINDKRTVKPYVTRMAFKGMCRVG